MTDNPTLHASSDSRYRLHRLALCPLLAENPLEALTTVKNSIHPAEQQPFLLFILQNGLGPLWHELLQQNNIRSFFSPEFTRELRNITSHTASLYLFQKTALAKINTILAKHAIPYALFKGAHTREHVYPDPALRYACDLDILVAGTDKVRAIKKLMEAGFSFRPLAENISHEATLADSRVSIDLHWDILRPGRTRMNMTDEFLAQKKEFSGYWALNNESTLFLMLVHPVFTKYSTAPQASLLHLIDLIRWSRTQRIDWEKVADYLERGGVQTAAWITAARLEMITGTLLPESFVQQIRPSSLKARYLRMWLHNDLSTRLLNFPLLIRTGFTLPAHDTLADAIRFTNRFFHEKKDAARKTKSLLQQLESP